MTWSDFNITDELVTVHVAWNDRYGHPDRLSSVEFTEDCELCAAEHPIDDGVPVFVGSRAFNIFKDEAAQIARIPHGRFAIESRTPHVGNILWDTIQMRPYTAGRFAMYLQNNGWTLSVAAEPFWSSWGGMSPGHFIETLQTLQAGYGAATE